MTTFWKHASTEKKLAQLDGGLECQMTSVQIATCVGATPAALRAFAHHHDRSFKNSTRSKPWSKKKDSAPRRRSKIEGHKLNHKEDFEYEDY